MGSECKRVHHDRSGFRRRPAVFHSQGWTGSEGNLLRWDGDAPEKMANPGQRFSFERIDEHHFKVTYFLLRKDEWSPVDSSTCTKG
jgi:hypothetical protein